MTPRGCTPINSALLASACTEVFPPGSLSTPPPDPLHTPVTLTQRPGVGPWSVSIVREGGLGGFLQLLPTCQRPGAPRPYPSSILFQGLRFEVVPSRFKEKLHKASFATPQAYAVETAKQKALEVADRMYQVSAPFLGLLLAGCPQVLITPVVNQCPSQQAIGVTSLRLSVLVLWTRVIHGMVSFIQRYLSLS